MDETTNLQLVTTPTTEWQYGYPGTFADVSAYLKVERRTINRYIVDDGLPCHAIGRGKRARKRFYREEVDAWLRSRCFDGSTADTSTSVPA